MTSRRVLAKRVASAYVKRLLSFRTDIEDLAGFPTYVNREGPAEEDSENKLKEPLPNEITDWTDHGTGYITPNVSDDAIRR